jgi:hypothetical protein
MSNLRARQILEVLDEDNNINRQVFLREQRQTTDLLQRALPKGLRDVGTEADVEKYVEQFALEANKIIGLIGLFVSGGSKLNTEKHLIKIMDLSILIKLYNAIMRAYINPAINSVSKTQIRTYIQSLIPYIDALIFNLNETLDVILGFPELEMYVPRIASAISVVDLMKKHIATNILRPISLADVHSNYDSFIGDPDKIRATAVGIIKRRDVLDEYYKPLTKEAKETLMKALDDRVRAYEADGFAVSPAFKAKLKKDLISTGIVAGDVDPVLSPSTTSALLSSDITTEIVESGDVGAPVSAPLSAPDTGVIETGATAEMEEGLVPTGVPVATTSASVAEPSTTKKKGRKKKVVETPAVPAEEPEWEVVGSKKKSLKKGQGMPVLDSVVEGSGVPFKPVLNMTRFGRFGSTMPPMSFDDSRNDMYAPVM